MTQNAVRYAELQETIRHNKAMEQETNRHNVSDEGIRDTTNSINSYHYQISDLEGIRHNQATEAINRIDAETNRLNWSVNQQNASTNSRNADTNARNAEINAQNAATNMRNADTNARNADYNYMNALTNQRNSDISAYMAETNRQRLDVDWYNAYSNRITSEANREQAVVARENAFTNRLNSATNQSMADAANLQAQVAYWKEKNQLDYWLPLQKEELGVKRLQAVNGSLGHDYDNLYKLTASEENIATKGKDESQKVKNYYDMFLNTTKALSSMVDGVEILSLFK